MGAIVKYFGSVVLLHAEWPHVCVLDCEIQCHGWVDAELKGVVTAFGLAAANVILPKLDTDPFRLSTSGKPFDPVFILSRSVSNIICSVIFGNRFEYDDERLLTIIRFINDNFQIMSSPWGEVSTLRSTRCG